MLLVPVVTARLFDLLVAVVCVLSAVPILLDCRGGLRLVPLLSWGFLLLVSLLTKSENLLRRLVPAIRWFSLWRCLFERLADLLLLSGFPSRG